MAKDGMTYAPKGKENHVVEPDAYKFAVTALDHGHIHGMTNGLLEAGATLACVYDPDEEKVSAFLEKYPNTKVVESLEEILADPEIKLVAAAAIPNKRSALGDKVMLAGKDYFTDKTAFTTTDQLIKTKRIVAETGQRFWVYFSERLHVEGAVRAGELIKNGAIGQVIQVTGFGPHRLDKEKRPDWFFNKEEYGGILCDIGSHQIEQFLYYTGNTDATVIHSKVGNFNNPDKPELEDYGDATLLGENGATHIFKVDWFTPDGLSTWGDGRLFITGTEGMIEVRKYVDIAREKTGDHLYLVNKEGEFHYELAGQVGFPFFGEMILDSIHRTEHAMTQEHIFKAQELCLKAQEQAIQIQTSKGEKK